MLGVFALVRASGAGAASERLAVFPGGPDRPQDLSAVVRPAAHAREAAIAATQSSRLAALTRPPRIRQNGVACRAVAPCVSTGASAAEVGHCSQSLVAARASHEVIGSARTRRNSIANSLMVLKRSRGSRASAVRRTLSRLRGNARSGISVDGGAMGSRSARRAMSSGVSPSNGRRPVSN